MFGNYIFWLAVVSLGCLIAERIKPWRKDQKLFRPELAQDYFWLIFNGYFFAIIFSQGFSLINNGLDAAFTQLFHVSVHSVQFLSGWSFYFQFIVVLISMDFIEWSVHNALHRIDWLWKFHRVHHSIVNMDWIGSFRFHWLESIIYKSMKYLPMAILGARWEVLLGVAIFTTLVGHLNHANLDITWGPLRYIFNSPRMHIWHHEKEIRGKAGVNFGITLSLWDWIFKTAYMPADVKQPSNIGFAGEEYVSDSILARFFVPFLNLKI